MTVRPNTSWKRKGLPLATCLMWVVVTGLVIHKWKHAVSFGEEAQGQSGFLAIGRGGF